MGFSGLLMQVSVLESAMPTAMNALVLAITYDLDVDMVSSIVFITTILSLVTLPIIITVIT
jgi:predicted permease